ncbi:hypothetical protein LUZ60_004397 [Juncus effusus]|nr:hypothetical protein LUZ60_004397 [Juncus effusus]
MAGGTGAENSVTEISLPYTPTWIVAAVCSFIILISLGFERFLHRFGKSLKRRNQKPLFEALQKVKEELMLLGFISLLLMVFQGTLQKICVPESFMNHLLPCKKEENSKTSNSTTTEHFNVNFIAGARRLLAAGAATSDHCTSKGKLPLLSAEAVHQLHIFIFVLAITHVCLSAITIVLGITQMNNWRHWEDKIQKQEVVQNGDESNQGNIVGIDQFKFIQDRFKGFGKAGGLYGWLYSFFKQFYGSVTQEDYITMRLGFINKHCKSNQKFNFYKYMIRALEADFKKVVGISWYLWLFVMVFLLLNVEGWHAYFWISLGPLIMLLIVGAKLEHIITELAHEVAERHTAVQGDLLVTPSDDLFWFGKPKIVLVLIHFILFQNAFEIAYFFWILTTYGYNSCIMDRNRYVIPRLVISVIVQLLCSYSTLPLYAIVSHMGSSFKSAIFEDHVQAGLVGWAQGAKKRKGKWGVTGEDGNGGTPRGNGGVQLGNLPRDSAVEKGTAKLISNTN